MIGLVLAFSYLSNSLLVHPPGSAQLFPHKVLDRDTLVPNFHTSSRTSWGLPPCICFSSEKMTRSASAPASSVPLTPSSPSIAAGVAVTALRAWGMPFPDQWRKLLTHSKSVMELLRGLVSLVSCGLQEDHAGDLRVSVSHLPAMVLEFSSSSVEPCFTMLHTCSPLVHGYAPSGRPTRCMASVTKMKPSGCALKAILMVVGCR